MKIFIVGAGTIGTYITELLNTEENDIKVIDTNRLNLREIEDKLDVKTINGNAVNYQFLKDANVDDCDLFIAVAADDAVNLISALTAKKLGAKKVIARVRNKEFLEGRKNTDYQNDFFGIDLVFCPENVSANEIAKRIRTPGISAIEFFAKDRILMREFNITAKNKYLKKPLKTFKLGDNIIVIGIYRKENIIIPTGDDYFLENDRVFILGDRDSIFKISVEFDEKEIKRKKIMIFGGGRTGFNLAKILESDDYQLKLLEPSFERCQFLANELNKTLVMNASALDTDFLNEENISDIDTFIAITENEQDNLLAAMLAKNNGVKETVVSINNPDYIPLSKMLGIDTTINQTISTANIVWNFLLKEKIKTIAVLIDERAKIIELEVKDTCSILDVPLYKAKIPKNTLIGAILRNDDVIIAKGSDILKVGDNIIIITLENNIEAISKIFY